MNKYALAVAETRSVLGEWIPEYMDEHGAAMANAVVERLIAKGVIQSTDPEDLVKVY